MAERGIDRYRRRKAAEAMGDALETLGALAEEQADTDAALCELYESAEQSAAETDAALCEIYEMVIGIQEAING